MAEPAGDMTGVAPSEVGGRVRAALATREVSIIDTADSSAAIAARELLGRNSVAHRWIDVERDPIAPLLRQELLATHRLPLIVFPDGSQLEGPPRHITPSADSLDTGGWEDFVGSGRWQSELAARAGLPTYPEP
jgi:hypothetical protein